MPFSRPTATRVPAGTVMFAPGILLRRSNTGRGAGATGAGAAVCGPSFSCAGATLADPRKRKKPMGARYSQRGRFMETSMLFSDADDAGTDARSIRPPNGGNREFIGGAI